MLKKTQIINNFQYKLNIIFSIIQSLHKYFSFSSFVTTFDHFPYN